MQKFYRRSITIGLLISLSIFVFGIAACICPTIKISGSGPVTILGDICGEEVDLETRTGGAIAFFEQCGEFDNDIAVFGDYGGEQLGFQIENPELLASGTTFSASELGFMLEGKVVAQNCGLDFGENEIAPSLGNVTIETYDGLTLKGTFYIELSSENITGSFDIDFNESLEPYFD